MVCRGMSDWQLEFAFSFISLGPEIRLDRKTIGSKPRALLPCESCFNFANKGLVLMQIRLAVNLQVFNTRVKLVNVLPALSKLH